MTVNVNESESFTSFPYPPIYSDVSITYDNISNTHKAIPVSESVMMTHGFGASYYLDPPFSGMDF